MNQDRKPQNNAPSWLLETERAMEEIGKDVLAIESKLRRASELRELDPRLKTEIQYVSDALDVVKISLSVVGVAAEDLLSESTLRDRKRQRAFIQNL